MRAGRPRLVFSYPGRAHRMRHATATRNATQRPHPARRPADQSCDAPGYRVPNLGFVF